MLFGTCTVANTSDLGDDLEQQSETAARGQESRSADGGLLIGLLGVDWRG